ncbi:UvrD-helicase domain-containing protein [Sphingobacterium hungaricum]
MKPVKILKASAGSGKTFSLTVHYLSLLFENEFKYREILAVTFTNKATEEMKTRILEVLEGLAKEDASDGIESYRALILKANPSLTPQSLQEKADKIYRRILHDYTRFSVSTIDGFVQKVIRGFAFELGLDSSYTLEMNLDKVKNNLVERLDKELDSKPELVEWIIDLAKERIENEQSWNYKTELINLISEIFKEKFTDFSDALYALGFENIDKIFSKYSKDAKEFKQNFEDIIHAKAQAFVQSYEQAGLTTDELAGKSRNPLAKANNIIQGQYELIDKLQNFVDNPEIWFQKKANTDSYYTLNPLLKELVDTFKSLEPHFILNSHFQKNIYYLRLMQEVALLLKSYRDENGTLLTSDAQNLLTGITEDAGDNPSFIWEKMGNRYKNFLFDEFQDTSVSQWKSFKSLVQNAVASPSENQIDQLIVGDTKQSIYRWRNGDWRILESQAKIDLGDFNILDDNLEENYRSSTEIIAFNNELFSSFPKIIQQELNSRIEELNSKPIEDWWKSQQYDQIVNHIYAQAKQNTHKRTKTGGTVKLKKFDKPEDDDRLFSDAIFKELALAYSIQEINYLIQELNYSYGNIAVLVRKNSEAKEVVNALMEAEIPVISGEALLIASNSAIDLLINTLYALVGYQENTSLYKANSIHLYHSIHKKTLSPNAFLDLKTKPFSELTAFLPEDLCINYLNWMQLPLPELIEHLIKAYGLDKLTTSFAYLLAFRDIISNATLQGEKGILSFLNWWEEEGYRKTLPSSSAVNAVQVMTVHKSKGLAFEAVLVPFCNLNLDKKGNIFWVNTENTVYADLRSIPLKYSSDLGKSAVATSYFEESLHNHIDALNMLYVATTRAKFYLFLGFKSKKEHKFSDMSDVFEHHFAEQWNEENEIIINNPVALMPKDTTTNTVSFDEYPTSFRISEVFTQTEERNIKHFLNENHASKDGSILHDILANTNNETELLDYLQKLVLQGIISKDETESYREKVLHVFRHPQLNALLSESTTSFTERSIVDEHGDVYRPDKIALLQHKIIVLDYKFTFEQKEAHREQIIQYVELLRNMGYEHVEGYLFYAIQEKLIAVN